mmetsp:Transcript_2043/g.6541  ORF Transcript_2043/g.6541 Transcript_2043/m.6541 type:complete len:263 (-) Transcript_2043:49-837(-)
MRRINNLARRYKKNNRRRRRASPISLARLDRLEVFLGSFRIRLHGDITRLPARRADFVGVVLNVLQRLEHAKSFIDGATEGEVVDGGVLDDTFAINDEQTTQSDTFFVQHVIRFSDFTLQVGHERVLQVAQTAIVAVGLQPRQVRELGVDRAAKNFGVDGGELFVAIGKRGDFRRAHKGEIERVEEEHDVLASVIAQLERLDELLVKDGVGGEVRRRVTNQRCARLHAHRRAGERLARTSVLERRGTGRGKRTGSHRARHRR